MGNEPPTVDSGDKKSDEPQQDEPAKPEDKKPEGLWANHKGKIMGAAALAGAAGLSGAYYTGRLDGTVDKMGMGKFARDPEALKFGKLNQAEDACQTAGKVFDKSAGALGTCHEQGSPEAKKFLQAQKDAAAAAARGKG